MWGRSPPHGVLSFLVPCLGLTGAATAIFLLPAGVVWFSLKVFFFSPMLGVSNIEFGIRDVG